MSSGLSALPLHTLLAAGYITYLGNAPEDTRTLMLDEWKNLCKLPEWTFLKFMSSESEMLSLKAEGLPADGILTFIYVYYHYILLLVLFDSIRFVNAKCNHLDELSNHPVYCGPINTSYRVA